MKLKQVKVEANPQPSISWQFEEEKVEFSERVQKLANGSLRYKNIGQSFSK